MVQKTDSHNKKIIFEGMLSIKTKRFFAESLEGFPPLKFYVHTLWWFQSLLHALCILGKVVVIILLFFPSLPVCATFFMPSLSSSMAIWMHIDYKEAVITYIHFPISSAGRLRSSSRPSLLEDLHPLPRCSPVKCEVMQVYKSEYFIILIQ